MKHIEIMNKDTSLNDREMKWNEVTFMKFEKLDCDPDPRKKFIEFYEKSVLVKLSVFQT